MDSSPHSVAVSVVPPPGFLQQQQLEATQTKLAVVLPTPLTPPQAIVLPTPLTPPQASGDTGDTALSYTSTRDGQGGYSFG